MSVFLFSFPANYTGPLPMLHGELSYSPVHHHDPHDPHAMVPTAAPSASPGVSDCFSSGATVTAATMESFLRLAVATTSSTPASPARHSARRLTSNAHSCWPNARAVARVTRKVCAGWASLPVNRPARIAVHPSSQTRPRRQQETKKKGGDQPSMTQRSTSEGGTCSVVATRAYGKSCPMFWKPRSARDSRRILRSSWFASRPNFAYPVSERKSASATKGWGETGREWRVCVFVCVCV